MLYISCSERMISRTLNAQRINYIRLSFARQVCSVWYILFTFNDETIQDPNKSCPAAAATLLAVVGTVWQSSRSA